MQTNKKDAFYFSHDSNAKDDPKCMLLIDQLGLEGYGAFWVLIEILRDQPNHVYPLELVPIIARRYNTSAEKMEAVIKKYGLFSIIEIDDKQHFYSNSLNNRMLHLEAYREKKRLAGIKSGESRRLKALQIEQTSNSVRTPVKQTSNKSELSKVKKSKVKESKVNKSIVMPYGSDAFLKAWQNWKSYKKEQFNFTYKGTISEQSALTRLANDCKTESNAIDAINYSISQSYKGIYQEKKAAAKKTSIYEPNPSIRDNPDRLKF